MNLYRITRINRDRALCLCILMGLCCNLAVATEDRARHLIEISGVSDHSASMSTMLPESLINFILGKDAQNHPQHEALRHSIKLYFSASVFNDAFIQQLNDRLSKDELDTLIQWYESDLGRRITALNLASNEDAYYDHVNEHLDELLQESDRLDFARRMDSRFQISGYSFQFSAYFSYAMSAGRARFRDPEHIISFDTFFDGMGALEAALMGEASEYMLASSVYRYSKLSNEELVEYETFLNTIAELKFNSVFNTTRNNTVRDQSIAWVERLPELLGDFEKPEE